MSKVKQKGEPRTRSVHSTERVVMPRELTSENEAHYLFIGEFNESIVSDCPVCVNADGEIKDDCYLCLGTGRFKQKVQISWPTIKEIYRKAVKHLAT